MDRLRPSGGGQGSDGGFLTEPCQRAGLDPAGGGGGSVTFSGTRQAVGLEVAGALLPAVLLAVGVRRRRRLHLWTGGAGDAGAGADRVAQARVCGFRDSGSEPSSEVWFLLVLKVTESILLDQSSLGLVWVLALNWFWF